MVDTSGNAGTAASAAAGAGDLVSKELQDKAQAAAKRVNDVEVAQNSAPAPTPAPAPDPAKANYSGPAEAAGAGGARFGSMAKPGPAAVGATFTVPQADLAMIEDVFTYHAPSGDQGQRYDALRAAAKQLAMVICAVCPSSADRTAAIRKLRESVMTANASIALGGKAYSGTANV